MIALALVVGSVIARGRVVGGNQVLQPDRATFVATASMVSGPDGKLVFAQPDPPFSSMFPHLTTPSLHTIAAQGPVYRTSHYLCKYCLLSSCTE